jgi:hypothetical protein
MKDTTLALAEDAHHAGTFHLASMSNRKTPTDSSSHVSKGRDREADLSTKQV